MSDKKETVVKPVVRFAGTAKIHKHPDGSESASITSVLDHPRLGQQAIVYTSKLSEVDDRDYPTLLVTRNTIYKKD